MIIPRGHSILMDVHPVGDLRIVDLAWKASILKCKSVANVTVEDLSVSIKWFIELPDHERENYVDYCQNSFMLESDLKDEMNPTITTGFKQIPIQDRQAIVDSFPGFPLMKKLAGDINPIFLFYLIPEALRSQENFSKINGSLLGDSKYREALIESCSKKFRNVQNYPEETLGALTNFVLDYSRTLGLDKENPILKAAIFYLSILVGEENPFVIVENVNSLQNNLGYKFDYHKYAIKLINQGMQLIDRKMTQSLDF